MKTAEKVKNASPPAPSIPRGDCTQSNIAAAITLGHTIQNIKRCGLSGIVITSNLLGKTESISLTDEAKFAGWRFAR